MSNKIFYASIRSLISSKVREQCAPVTRENRPKSLDQIPVAGLEERVYGYEHKPIIRGGPLVTDRIFLNVSFRVFINQYQVTIQDASALLNSAKGDVSIVCESSSGNPNEFVLVERIHGRNMLTTYRFDAEQAAFFLLQNGEWIKTSFRIVEGIPSMVSENFLNKTQVKRSVSTASSKWNMVKKEFCLMGSVLRQLEKEGKSLVNRVVSSFVLSRTPQFRVLDQFINPFFDRYRISINESDFLLKSTEEDLQFIRKSASGDENEFVVVNRTKGVLSQEKYRIDKGQGSVSIFDGRGNWFKLHNDSEIFVFSRLYLDKTSIYDMFKFSAPKLKRFDQQIILNTQHPDPFGLQFLYPRPGGSSKGLTDVAQSKNLKSQTVHYLDDSTAPAGYYEAFHALSSRSRIYIVGHCLEESDFIFGQLSDGTELKLHYQDVADLMALHAPQLINDETGFGITISLVACYAGSGGENSFAQKLSRALDQQGIKASVLARTGEVSRYNGKSFYRKRVDGAHHKYGSKIAILTGNGKTRVQKIMYSR